MGNNSFPIKKQHLLSVILIFFVCGVAFSQYKLTDAQITKGFIFLKEKGGFRNPSSVQFVSHSTSNHNYSRSCFTWAQYTVNAQNGFGGYARGNYIVFFFDGQPILKLSDDHPYYMLPNSDKVADEVIALSRAYGSYVGDECPGDAEIRKQRERKFAEEVKAKDKQTREAINLAISNKDYFTALQLSYNLIDKDNQLMNRINEGWVIERDRLNVIYATYMNNFAIIKKEYYSSPDEFLLKYQSDIKSKEITINGEEANQKRIAFTTDPQLKADRVKFQNDDGYLFSKKGDKYLICPIGVFGNYYLGRYNPEFVGQLKITVLFDTSANLYVPFIEFIKDTVLIERSPIYSTNSYRTQYYEYPFPAEIREMYQKIINNSGGKILEALYKQQILFLDSDEKITLSNLSKINFPGEGKRNDKYDALKEEFNDIQFKIKQFSEGKTSLLTKNFYSPSILYLIKQMYPNADSLIFIKGDYQKKSLDKIGLHFYSYTNGSDMTPFGCIIPLVDDKVELKDNKLVVYDNSGNYFETEVNLIEDVTISLLGKDLEKLKLDSTFFELADGKINFEYQYPFNYKHFILKYTENPEYRYNENLSIQLIPNFHYDTRMENIEIVPFRNDLTTYKHSEWTNPSYKPLQQYFIEFTKYLRFKAEGNSKKATKSLEKANEYLETYKKIYFGE